MKAVVYLVSWIAIVFGVCGRFYWANQIGATHDTWYHLHVAQRIRRERALPDRIEQFIIEGPYDYPPLFHVLLAAVPTWIALRFIWLVSPTVDLVHMGLLAGVTYWLTGDPMALSVALAVYATFPMILKQFSYPTPRAVGSLLVSATLLLVFYAVTTGSLAYLVPAVLFGGVVLNTHKMSSQTLAFLLLFLAAVEFDPLYLGVLLATLTAGVALSLGHYLTILQGHVNIIDFWRHQYAAGRPPGVFFERFGVIDADEESPDTVLAALKRRVKSQDWLLFVADGAWVFALVGIFTLGVHPPFGPFVHKLALWGVFIAGFAVLTQYVPKFKLVGEGYKYFMWGGFPSAVVVSVVVSSSGLAFVRPLFVMCLVGVLGFAFLRTRGIGAVSDRRNLVDSGSAVLEFLADADGQNVMCLPPDMYFQILYHTDKCVLFHQNPKLEGESYFPVPTESLRQIVDNFNIDLLLLDTRRLREDAFDLDSFTTVFETDGYVIVQTS